MNKSTIILVIFILLAVFNTSVYAGEAHQMLMNGEQSALVIGRVQSINEKFYSIEVEKVLMGNIAYDVFKLTDTEYSTVPPLKTGEIWVLSLNEYNSNYGIARGAYQADKSNYNICYKT